MFILFEGNIGSGKSTLINLVTEKLNSNKIKVYDSGNIFFKNESPVNLLKLYQNNDTELKFPIQLNFYYYLFNLHKMFQNENEIIITSRSLESAHKIFTQSLFDKKMLKKDEFDYLTKIYNDLSKENKENKIDLYVYLKSKNDTVDRKFNELISTNDLNSYYDNFSLERENVVKEIKITNDFNNKSNLDLHAEEICKIIKNYTGTTL